MATAESATPAVLVTSAVSFAVWAAGWPYAVGYAGVGILGAAVGHARYTIDREKQVPALADLTIRQHCCMIARGILMAEFVCLILLLAWVEMNWAWTWGLIVAAISSVFANDAIELMWIKLKTWFAERRIP